MSIQLIQQAICYMEEQIYENINYADVAGSVHMSSYNFHRTFSFIAGMTANEYIRKRRLTLAAQELQETDLSVIDAAYKYGYESPESFSKAFSRFHASTPKQAKRKGAKLQLFSPLVIKIILEGGSIMDYRMEHREHQQFLALVRAFPNETASDDNDHSIPDFWSECSEKNQIEPMRQLCPERKRDLYGLCSLPIVRRIFLRQYRLTIRRMAGYVTDCQAVLAEKKTRNMGSYFGTVPKFLIGIKYPEFPFVCLRICFQ